MDQRQSELEENENTALKTNNDVRTDMTVKPADSTDVAKSEQAVKEDMQKVDSGAVDADAEPVQIKEQIEQTRSNLGETIDAIQEKLSFSHLSDQVSEQISSAVETAKDAVYDATIGRAESIMQNVSKGLGSVSESMGDAGSQIVKTVRRNPLPLALVGAGIGLVFLMQSRRKSNHKTYQYKPRGKYKYDDEHNESRYRSTGSTGGGSRFGDVQKKAGDIAGSAYDSVTGAANSAYEGVSSFASSTGNQVQHVAHRARHQYEHTLEENPLAIGAVALAIGAIVGLAIPTTDYENEWMGESKENLVQSVEGVARDAFSKAQQVAGEVTKTVREQSQTQKQS